MVPDGRDLVLVGEGVLHIGGGKAARLHRLGIKIDLHRTGLAALRCRGPGAAHRGQAGTRKILRLVRHLLFRHGAGGKRHLQHRHGGGAVFDDVGRLHVGRHLPDGALGNRGHFRRRQANIHIGLEIDLGDPQTRNGQALHMLHVIDRGGKQALVIGHHPGAHVVRREPRILEGHAQDRNADLGKDVGRRADRRQRPEDQDHQGHDDKRIRPFERDLDQPIHGTAVTTIPAFSLP